MDQAYMENSSLQNIARVLEFRVQSCSGEDYCETDQAKIADYIDGLRVIVSVVDNKIDFEVYDAIPLEQHFTR